MNKAVLSSFIVYFEFVAFEGWVEGRYRYGLGAMALSGQKFRNHKSAEMILSCCG